jgi:hypothetical protein
MWKALRISYAQTVRLNLTIPCLSALAFKIEYFINYEVSDYEGRTIAASSGGKKPRTVSSGQEYANSGGKFKAIQLGRW